MKFGQAMSVYEAAIPEEFAEPYREALTKLQNAAPPMPTAHRPPGDGRATRHRLARPLRRVRRRIRGRGKHRSGPPWDLA